MCRIKCINYDKGHDKDMLLLVINTEGKMKESKKSLSEITIKPVLRVSSVLCLYMYIVPNVS